MSGLAEELIESVPVMPVRQTARPPVRAQEHASRHVVLPQFQRPPEDTDAQAAPEQLRRCGQTVRSGADDYGIVFHDE